jgi:hypothetical protein
MSILVLQIANKALYFPCFKAPTEILLQLICNRTANLDRLDDEHEFRPDRLLKSSSTFFNGTNKGGKQLEGLANAENRCNWIKEAILAALSGMQRLARAGV